MTDYTHHLAVNDPLDLNEPSGFESFLKWLGRPGYAVRDILSGNPAGAVRQSADFLLDPIDAVLPGDVLPAISKPEDYKEMSDIIGGMDPGIGKTVVDIAGGIATDPMTYLGAGPVVKAGTMGLRGAASGASKIAGKTKIGADLLKSGAEKWDAIKRTTRAATGAFNPTETWGATGVGTKEVIRQAGGKGVVTSQAGLQYIVPELAKVDPVTQRRAIEMIRGVESESVPGIYRDMGVSTPNNMVTKAEQMARIDQRLSQMTAWTPEEKAAVRDAADKTTDFLRDQFHQGIDDTVFHNEMWHEAGVPREIEDLIAQQQLNPSQLVKDQPFEQWAQQMGFTKGRVSRDYAPADYLPGKYDYVNPKTAAEHGLTPSILKSKEIKTSKQLADFLNDQKAKLDDNLTTLIGDYSTRMGGAVKQAEIAKVLVPGYKALTEGGAYKKMQDAIDALEQAGKWDDATMLRTATKGLPPREGLEESLANFNRDWFKKFATMGAFLPRPAFHTRNAFSSAGQAISNPEARGITGSLVARIPGDLWRSYVDGARAYGFNLPKSSVMADIDQAIIAGRGNREAFINAIKDKHTREAVSQGVVGSGFISAEELSAKLEQAQQGAKNWRNLRDAPQEIGKSLEDYMRLGMYKDLRNKGKSIDDAARITQDTLYDYQYSSLLNRRIRDIIPFFQFTAKAVPQQAKFLMEEGLIPSLGRNAIEKLYAQGDDAILPPYLQNNPVVPIGRNEKGQPEYLTSFGMPFEVLGNIPNPSDDPFTFLKQTRQDIVGAMTPPLKTLGSAVMGVDPYFGGPFGSYDKNPQALQALGMDDRGSFGRAYNIAAGTGLIQPISAPLQTISTALDPRQGLGGAVLNTATGIKIKAIDEDRALQQLLEEKLKTDPSVQRHETLFQYGANDETAALLQQLREIKKKIHAEKKAAAKKAD